METDIQKARLRDEMGPALASHWYRLYHGTTPASAHKIVEQGFKAGEDNVIWLTPNVFDALGYAFGALVIVEFGDVAFKEMQCEFGEAQRVFCHKWNNEYIYKITAWLKTAERSFGRAVPPGLPEQLLNESERLSKELRAQGYEPYSPQLYASVIAHPLVLERFPYPAPDQMELGGLKVFIPPPRGTPVEKKKWFHDSFGENAILRTSDKLDNISEHLGYQPVTVTPEVMAELTGIIPTDMSIQKASQEKLRETEIVPDEKLDFRQLAHLKLAREIAKRLFWNPPSNVFAAIIPPASDRVRTAGMYGTTTKTVYLSLDQLFSGRATIDTLVHELAHHRQFTMRGEAEDLTESHATAMTELAAKLVQEVTSGTLDELLKEVSW